MAPVLEPFIPIAPAVVMDRIGFGLGVILPHRRGFIAILARVTLIFVIVIVDRIASCSDDDRWQDTGGMVKGPQDLPGRWKDAQRV